MGADGQTLRSSAQYTTLRRRRIRHTVPTGPASLADGLAAEVGQPFEFLTGIPVSTVVPVPGCWPVGEELLMRGQWPLCEHCVPGGHFGGGWRRHLHELRRRPSTHWHRCMRGHRCGVVPVQVKRRVLAACRIVCGGAESEQEFQRRLELLRTLVEAYVADHRVAMVSLLEQARAARARDQEQSHHGTPPPVQRALAYVEANFSDPTLTVARIAAALEVNSAYLGHIFREQVGVPLHRFIIHRRIDRAQRLLAETGWQVKRIARETGHGNADWFSHLFHRETGFTPREYRSTHAHCGEGTYPIPPIEGAARRR